MHREHFKVEEDLSLLPIVKNRLFVNFDLNVFHSKYSQHFWLN